MHNRNKAYFDKVKAIERLRVIVRLLKKEQITEEEAVNMIEGDSEFYKIEKQDYYSPGVTWINPYTGGQTTSGTITYTTT